MLALQRGTKGKNHSSKCNYYSIFPWSFIEWSTISFSKQRHDRHLHVLLVSVVAICWVAYYLLSSRMSGLNVSAHHIVWINSKPLLSVNGITSFLSFSFPLNFFSPIERKSTWNSVWILYWCFIPVGICKLKKVIFLKMRSLIFCTTSMLCTACWRITHWTFLRSETPHLKLVFFVQQQKALFNYKTAGWLLLLNIMFWYEFSNAASRLFTRKFPTKTTKDWRM